MAVDNYKTARVTVIITDEGIEIIVLMVRDE